MIRSDEFRKGEGQIQFSLAALESTRLRPGRRVRNEDVAVAERAITPYEINLSGSQLLVGLVFGLCMVCLFAWGVARYWLLGQ
jgi:hypothetical protein